MNPNHGAPSLGHLGSQVDVQHELEEKDCNLSQNILSKATVMIERPARYGKQLVNDLKRKNGGEWDAEAERGWVNLGEDRAEVVAAADRLELSVEGPADAAERLENVVGRHLVGFARNLEIEVQWHRNDNASGTRQATE